MEIIRFCRSIGHAVVDVFYREQEIVEGTVQIVVIEGKVNKITLENKGTKWFSDQLIMGEMHLRSGEPILQNQLDRDVAILNQNNYVSLGTFQGTFREVQPELTPGESFGRGKCESQGGGSVSPEGIRRI